MELDWQAINDANSRNSGWGKTKDFITKTALLTAVSPVLTGIYFGYNLVFGLPEQRIVAHSDQRPPNLITNLRTGKCTSEPGETLFDTRRDYDRYGPLSGGIAGAVTVVGACTGWYVNKKLYELFGMTQELDKESFLSPLASDLINMLF